MIIWRGWGILAVIFAAIGGGVGNAVLGGIGAGIGLLLAAVATWFAGQHFNVKAPEQKLTQWRDGRRAQLDELVRTGQFSLGPGQPQPRSEEEARSWADQLMAVEEQQISSGMRNRHSVFWIPMQFLAYVLGAIGVLVLVLTLVRH